MSLLSLNLDNFSSVEEIPEKLWADVFCRLLKMYKSKSKKDKIYIDTEKGGEYTKEFREYLKEHGGKNFSNEIGDSRTLNKEENK